MKALEDKKLILKIDKVAGIIRKYIVGNDKTNDNIYEKIKESGVDVFDMKNDLYDGACLWDKKSKKPIIFLDDSQGEDRKLFTLAHELGHLVLQYKWVPGQKMKTLPEKAVLSVSFRDKDKNVDTEELGERVINEFAGAFLMPKSLVENLLEGVEDKNLRIKKVSEWFGVTGKAAKNRLTILEKLNC